MIFSAITRCKWQLRSRTFSCFRCFRPSSIGGRPYLPDPNLFDQALVMMARFLPPDSMALVRRVLADVITRNRGAFLSFGILGTLWAASGGFSAAIEALNIAYDVEDDRPFWKTRPLAIGLALIIGSLQLLALSVMIVGPRFGGWLAGRVHLSGLFVLLWPYVHWSMPIGSRC